MNENNEVMAPETVDDLLDSAWSDEEDVETMDSAETPADQPEGKQEATGAPERAGEQPPADQPGEGGADQPQNELFTLRNREETRQVTRDELIAMAQKGWDYDTVREERDQLRQYRSEADPAYALVRSYAQRNGMDVPQYLDFCRKQELMAGGMTEQAAAERVGMEKERAELDARQAEVRRMEARQSDIRQRAQQAAQARQRDIEAFYRAYPGVDPKSIPQEVWAAVKEGDTLTNAYTMHENRRLSAELAAERQNKTNRQRTTGGLSGNSGAELDEIDRLWAEDD